MKILLFSVVALVFCSVNPVVGAMRADEIAIAMLSCKPFTQIEVSDVEGAKVLLHQLVEVAQNDPKTIRAGLGILQKVIESPGIRDTPVYRNICLTVPVLFSVMFKFPSGRIRDIPRSQISYLPMDSVDAEPERVVEYSLPVVVDSAGTMRIGWAFGSYAGHINSNFTEMFDEISKTHTLRGIVASGY